MNLIQSSQPSEEYSYNKIEIIESFNPIKYLNKQCIIYSFNPNTK